jgi:hypothetical protein
MCVPFRHAISSCSVSAAVPYSCLFCKICVAYAEVELLVLMYLICSLYLTFIALPDCPIYTSSHVLHFDLYIPLGFLHSCFSESCCYIVLVARKAIFRLVCLNKLVMHLTSGLKCVNTTHLLCEMVLFFCCCFCFLFTNPLPPCTRNDVHKHVKHIYTLI